MTRPVLWPEDALGDLEDGIAWIAARNPASARRVLADIRAAVDRLGMRATGRPGRVTGTFEKTVTKRPYIVAYAMDSLPDGPERIVILRVIHTARDWPRGVWPV